MIISTAVVVISFSIIIQLTAAIFALLIIRQTGFKYSWVFISAALFLMSIRRLVPLVKMFLNIHYSIDLTNEMIGLVISIAMLMGVLGIKKIFIEQLALEEAQRNSEAKWRLYFDRSIVSIVLVGMDKKFIDCNEAFCGFTGLTKDKILGKTIADITYIDDLDIGKIEMKKIAQGEKTYSTFEKRYVHASGSIIWGEINICLLNNGVNKTPVFLATIVDITERKGAEEKIKALLEEKNMILKEVHHRIKNNMSTISSLLSLQAQGLNEPSAVSALQEARNKVLSMGVLYDKLYQASDFTNLSIKVFLPTLVDEILSNFSSRQHIKLEIDVEDIVLDVKRLQTLGIIINELLTNIMKYAFKGRETGVITVSASRGDGNIIILIQDDGVGIPETVSFEVSTGFGLKLVQGLTEQLNGSIRMEQGVGTKIILEFAL